MRTDAEQKQSRTAPQDTLKLKTEIKYIQYGMDGGEEVGEA